MRPLSKIAQPLKNGLLATHEAWPSYSPEQQGAIVAANVVTAGRLVLRAGIEAQFLSGNLTRGQYVTANSIADMLDKLDGHIIRSNDAANEWGKVFDPYVDKVDFFGQELLRTCRGEILPATFLIRFLRDVASTQLRTNAAEDGTKNPAANKWGQVSTTVRSVSLRVNDLFPHSRGARVAEHLATAALLASLGRNWAEYKA
ncbi:MAG TPA: hypothetical protein PKV96_03680 [Candidatus Saccharimonas sp.]|nr:hypothetical protein [Candidatus Saccharimonas sp.]